MKWQYFPGRNNIFHHKTFCLILIFMRSTVQFNFRKIITANVMKKPEDVIQRITAGFVYEQVWWKQ